MVSNHYPMIYSHDWGWLNLAIIMISGVFIRQFFVLKHRHKMLWWLPITALILLSALVVALKPQTNDLSNAMISDQKAMTIMQQRCTTCHSQTPTQIGFSQAPNGIVLDTKEQVLKQKALLSKVILNGYMPVANITQMTDLERHQITAWLQ